MNEKQLMALAAPLKGSIFTREQVMQWFSVIRGALQSLVNATPSPWDNYGFSFVDGILLSNPAVIDKVCEILGIE